MHTLVFAEPPPNFNPTVEVAGCYCEWQGRLLFMRRHPAKHQGGTWGVPGGKLEPGEKPIDAVIREVYEEAGLLLKRETLHPLAKLYIRIPRTDYIFHRFSVALKHEPELNIGLDEHDEAKWVTPQEALRLPLIQGGKEALLSYMESRSQKS